MYDVYKLILFVLFFAVCSFRVAKEIISIKYKCVLHVFRELRVFPCAYILT